MLNCKKYVLIVIYSLLVSRILISQVTFEGRVTDNGGDFLGNGAEPVVNALITLIDQTDTTKSFSDYTDEQGYFKIMDISTGINVSSVRPDNFQLFQNYPNPFNPSTVIRYQLSQPCNVIIEIHNISGQKIKTLLNSFQNISGSVIWHGENNYGEAVAAGLYICTMKVMDRKYYRKMLLIDGGGTGTSFVSKPVNNQQTMKSVKKLSFSNQYTLKITGDNISPYEQPIEIDGNMTQNYKLQRIVIGNDSTVYLTVKIGNQWWMAENLKEVQYRNGDVIPEVTDNSIWADLSTGARCSYDNDENNASTYGYLYNWYVVNDDRNIAPEGWHVPTDVEWKELEMALGMSQAEADGTGWRGTNEGNKLAGGADLWPSVNFVNNVAFNESRFSALPAGFRYDNGYFSTRSFGTRASLWSATKSAGYETYFAWCRWVDYYYLGVFRFHNNKQAGFSVRLVRGEVSVTLIHVSPSSATVSNHQTQRFTCTATYSNQTLKDVSTSVLWSLSSGNIGSIDANGLFTAHSTNTGTETITATYRGETAEATITVEKNDIETDTVNFYGTTYKTVKIGNQWWLAENLKVAHYRNGDTIEEVTNNSTWESLTTGARCTNNNIANNESDTYGYLYNWYALEDPRNIAPQGWHVPTDVEWEELEMALGMTQAEADDTGWRGTNEGSKLAGRADLWLDGNLKNNGAFDVSGFSALPAGYRGGFSGIFGEIGYRAAFWSSTEDSDNNDYAFYRALYNDTSGVYRNNYIKQFGYSVRLVRD